MNGIYPLDLQFTLANESAYYAPKDAFGIPMRHYRSIGVQYNPTRVAAYGLAHYNAFRNGSSAAHREHFMRAANWFASSANGRWSYEFPWGDLEPPWISCMSQGEGISVLTRAFQLTGEQQYLDVALRAAEPFRVPLAAGGVRSSLDDGSVFLEEYPDANASRTLNGFLYALVGISDLAHLVPETAANVEFRALCDTIASQWERWDTGYWSAYDLHQSPSGLRNPASPDYHNIHVTLFRFLARVIPDVRLMAPVRRWTYYRRSALNRWRALYSKVQYRRECRSQV